MKDKYSIVFIPKNEIVEEIKKIKLTLAKNIGWFNSKNSIAHITICEFNSSETEIKRINTQINRKVATLSSFKIFLDEFDSYPNGAFYIKPTEDSKSKMKRTMQLISNSFTTSKKYKSNDPHLSIARKLNSENLEIAKKMFQKVELSFDCNAIYLRKFNPNKKQYDIINSFPLNDDGFNTPTQLSLF